MRTEARLADFFRDEAAGGLILMAAAALALIVANSPLAGAYRSILHGSVGGLDLLHWINDALMAGFFLLVGLEIKRELVEGELSTWSSRVLPAAAAVGGMALPALIFAGLNLGHGGALRGWAIPAATDIAFALGVLALLGSRVPASLKVFLTALAIIDDLGAVVIIAVFYAAGLAWTWLAGAGVALLVLIALNRLQVVRLWPYLVVGLALWLCVFRSGVHPTVAGVLLALTIPSGRPADGARPSPLHRLEHGLSPWIAFGVVPLFGFANAGLSLLHLEPAAALQPATLGAAAGLFLGKQVGVMACAGLVIGCRLAPMPQGASWLQLYGVSILCGIGFTMSLFIAMLAYVAPALLDAAKLGVLAGSIVAGLAGWAVLRLAPSSVSPGPGPGRG